MLCIAGLQVVELHALSHAMWQLDWVAKAFSDRLIKSGFSELIAGTETNFRGTYRHGDEEFRIVRQTVRQTASVRVSYEFQGSCTANRISLLGSVIQVDQQRSSFVWEQPHGPDGPRAAIITDMSEVSELDFETIEELLNFLMGLRVV